MMSGWVWKPVSCSATELSSRVQLVNDLMDLPITAPTFVDIRVSQFVEGRLEIAGFFNLHNIPSLHNRDAYKGLYPTE